MTKTKVKLSEVLAQVKEVLKKAVEEKETGVVFAYKGTTKFLSLSIENIEDDVIDEDASKDEKAEAEAK